MSTDTPEPTEEPTEPAADATPAPADEPATEPETKPAEAGDDQAAEETVPAADAPTEEAAPAAEEAEPAEAVAEDAEQPAEAAAGEASEEAASDEGDAAPSLADGLDIGSTSVDGVEVDYKPVIRGKIDRFGVAMGTGRRKTSVARVRIKEGNGEFKINGREVAEYLPMERDQKMVKAPLRVTDTLGKVDVWVRVKGGGTTGQTGAIVLGVARALQVRQPELHHTLSEAGLLTRDGRMVERKKYGLRKARRSFQFSKR